ncbi:DUF3048 domain-containing protein [Herbiconiux sp. KACC 21604]|uniref:DUF3048 domain-containing protein n=1 Tax=unclassified Herbiconiux TaxID=2618217 RepID=UPI001491416F|nr:DUF3048 domain-containing protein [Herbiconiux sp. SALV-R1]QJU52535.1 DUF3048 domain-containing protein [Herbiconiux sp. SALV-R1]WPO87410.1 DUF3048 domain-containing protein [Herbiconiux sp. KACC 21604]
MRTRPRTPLRAGGLAAVLLAAGALAGCVFDAAVPPPAVTPTGAFDADYSEPVALVPAPLRGTLVEPGALQNPSLAAKIDNHEDARPQIGLEQADLVFEELVEGGLTRYVAVWQSDVPELIGPVRSIRPMDPDIISPLGGIVAYSGGQEQFVDMMLATPVYNAIHGEADTQETFYRIDGYDSPHDVVVKASELVAEHAQLAPPAQQFAYSADVLSSSAAVDGEPTATLSLVFSDSRFPSWQWDEASSSFLRSQEGEPDLGSTGAQLAATNVVSLLVNEVYDYDEEVPRAVLVTSGEGWASTGGKTVHLRWSKDAAASPIRLVDDAGGTIRLAPGSTWVELVPREAGSVTVTAPEPVVEPAPGDAGDPGDPGDPVG